jgi:hypothetical protein
MWMRGLDRGRALFKVCEICSYLAILLFTSHIIVFLCRNTAPSLSFWGQSLVRSVSCLFALTHVNITRLLCWMDDDVRSFVRRADNGL